MTISLDKVDLFTQAMNAAFVNSYEASVDPPVIDMALTRVPSKGRIEQYPWLFPPPMLRQWKGYRRYAKLGETNYRVPNLTYTAEFEIANEDLDDDQIAGFKLQGANLGKNAKSWPVIQTQLTLALGQTTPCFDGSNFFASTHNIGDYATGGNIVTGTAAASDGVTHAMACLVCTNSMVKPLLWQDREGPDFQTDMGEKISLQNRMTRWWTDLRGAAAFGFWWDAILVKWSNTPTVAEMQTTLGNVNARFRGFKLPKNLADDVDQYPHLNTAFDEKTLAIVCSTKIEHIVRQALTLSLISNTENYFKGFGKLIPSGYLDGVT